MAEQRTGTYEPELGEDGEYELNESYFKAWTRAVQLEVRTHVPCTVTKYDAATQTVDVTVDHLTVVKASDGKKPAAAVSTIGEGADMSAVLEPMRLTGLRVCWPSTKAGYLTLPLAPGDTGELHVSDRSLTRWRKEGKPVDPLLGLLHQLVDGNFYPGLCPDKGVIQPAADTEAAVLHGPKVKLGRDAQEPIALAGLVRDYLLGMLDAMAPVAGDGGAAAIAGAKAYVNGHPAEDMGADTVLAK
jgi:hypothetical protein